MREVPGKDMELDFGHFPPPSKDEPPTFTNVPSKSARKRQPIKGTWQKTAEFRKCVGNPAARDATNRRRKRESRFFSAANPEGGGVLQFQAQAMHRKRT
ncbi:hypothetical protein H0H93_005512 [Arthromyces matolae]|nr:hypothetical protein H0H93_005512 [Arthromyces matolae]